MNFLTITSALLVTLVAGGKNFPMAKDAKKQTSKHQQPQQLSKARQAVPTPKVVHYHHSSSLSFSDSSNSHRHHKKTKRHESRSFSISFSSDSSSTSDFFDSSSSSSESKSKSYKSSKSSYSCLKHHHNRRFLPDDNCLPSNPSTTTEEECTFSQSWAESEVPKETVKRRIKNPKHHIYKSSSSEISASSLSSSGSVDTSCNSTTQYTTVEVIRPHKARHHKRKVSVKEEVKSQTTEIEVIRPKTANFVTKQKKKTGCQNKKFFPKKLLKKEAKRCGGKKHDMKKH